jgi:putative ABC transport system permease protein
MTEADRWGGGMRRVAGDFFADARYGIRGLRRAPGFFAVAVVSVGIGVGATTTMFAALDTFLLRPPPQVAGLLSTTAVATDGTERNPSAEEFAAWREAAGGTPLAAYQPAGFNVAGDPAERVSGVRVTSGFFDVVGVTPTRGRGFVAEEYGPGGAFGVGGVGGSVRVAVLSHGFWNRRFAAAPGVVGSTISLDGEPHLVVGVMPPEFAFPRTNDEIWVPMGAGLAEAAGPVVVIGRASASVGNDELAGRLTAIQTALVREGRSLGEDSSVRVVALHDRLITERLRLAALIASVAAALVLAIAIFNLANLLLARGEARRHELAVRQAIGAGRGRLARQLMTESFVVSAFGAGLGVLLAILGARGLEAVWASVPDTRPMPGGPLIGWRTLVFAVSVGLVAAVAFGAGPAWAASRGLPSASLRKAGGPLLGTAGRTIFRQGLVAAQVAVALILLVSSLLLVRSFLGLQTAELGIDTENRLTYRISFPEGTDQQIATATVVSVERALLETPGVRSVGAGESLPLEGVGRRSSYDVPGAAAASGTGPSAPLRIVTPSYHAALGIPLLRGRTLSDSDHALAAPVVVINESMARRHWAGADPIGQHLVLSSVTHEIVGVVGDTREWGPHTPGPAMIYASALQVPLSSLSFVVETAGDPSADPSVVADRIRDAVGDVAPDLAAYDLKSFSALLTENTARSEAMARVMAVFAAIALILASIGVYGTMAYLVACRRAELGVRRAIGATGRDVVGLILRQGGRLLLAGVAAGLVLAAASTRALSSFLADVPATDPVSFLAATVGIMAAALLACLVPTWRAVRVDPVETLRQS